MRSNDPSGRGDRRRASSAPNGALVAGSLVLASIFLVLVAFGATRGLPARLSAGATFTPARPSPIGASDLTADLVLTSTPTVETRSTTATPRPKAGPNGRVERASNDSRTPVAEQSRLPRSPGQPFTSTPEPDTAPASQLNQSVTYFGVNTHPLQDAYALYPPDQILDRVAALGASVVRIDVHWNWLEWTGPGVASWDHDQLDKLNAFLDAANRRHIRVLAVVMDTPCWASSDPSRVCGQTEQHYNWRFPPRDPRDFARFLHRLVPLTRGRIQFWEIWNEPNIGQFWAHPDPRAYATLLRAAYPAIKADDPAAIVLAGALAPVDGDSAGAVDSLEFVDAMYAAGAKGSFDALSLHSYSDGRPPTWADARSPAHSFALTAPVVHQHMLGHGDPRPIWITESGWTTVGSCADCWTPSLPVGEDEQASNLAREIEIVRSWSYVQGLVWYELFDRGGPGARSREDHFGLFRHDLSPKPAVRRLQELLQGPG